MKNEQNQELSSSSLLAVIGLVGFSLAIIATPWNRDLQANKAEKALQKAEVVGYQIVQLYREATKDDIAQISGTRSPASVEASDKLIRTTGTMGQDPWGQPFRYRLLNADKSKIRILVWSAGPNQLAETSDLENEEKPLMAQPTYGGDDLGLVLTLSQN